MRGSTLYCTCSTVRAGDPRIFRLLHIPDGQSHPGSFVGYRNKGVSRMLGLMQGKSLEVEEETSVSMPRAGQAICQALTRSLAGALAVETQIGGAGWLTGLDTGIASRHTDDDDDVDDGDFDDEDDVGDDEDDEFDDDIDDDEDGDDDVELDEEMDDLDDYEDEDDLFDDEEELDGDFDSFDDDDDFDDDEEEDFFDDDD